MLSDWLAEDGALSVHIDLPHSGGAGESHQVGTLRELQQLIARQTHPEIVILIFRGRFSSEEDLNRSCQVDWVYANSDKVLCLSVAKNRNSYDLYTADKERYAAEIRAWFTDQA
jgi:hypothetical protein